MTHETTAPRIYAACLASYNSGRLHGEWIDCEGKSADELQQAINEMLAKSPYPNVQRVRCSACDHIQDLHAQVSVEDDACDECGGEMGAPFASAEEWAIHNHEGFAGLISSECPDLDNVAAIAEVFAEGDEDKRRGLVWLVKDQGCSVSDAIDKCEDVRTYDGEAKDYAAEFAEDCYSEALEAMPDFLRYHIDWEGVARDLILGGHIAEAEQDGERFLITNANEF